MINLYSARDIENAFLTIVDIVKHLRQDPDKQTQQPPATTDDSAQASPSPTGGLGGIVTSKKVIDDDNEHTKTTWSSTKVKAFVTEKISEAVNTIIGNADEANNTLGEIAQNVANLVKTDAGLLSFKTRQDLTEDDATLARSNLKLGKLAKLDTVVDDVSEQSTDASWSVTKSKQNKDELKSSITDIEELLQRKVIFDKPTASNQVLFSVLEGSDIVMKWMSVDDLVKMAKEGTATSSTVASVPPPVSQVVSPPPEEKKVSVVEPELTNGTYTMDTDTITYVDNGLSDDEHNYLAQYSLTDAKAVVIENLAAVKELDGKRELVLDTALNRPFAKVDIKARNIVIYNTEDDNKTELETVLFEPTVTKIKITRNSIEDVSEAEAKVLKTFDTEQPEFFTATFSVESTQTIDVGHEDKFKLSIEK